MEIKFSRHANRRLKLYGISRQAITGILSDLDLVQGEHVIIKDIAGIKFPVKIVISVEGSKTMVKTNYPLKKGKKK